MGSQEEPQEVLNPPTEEIVFYEKEVAAEGQGISDALQKLNSTGMESASLTFNQCHDINISGSNVSSITKTEATAGEPGLEQTVLAQINLRLERIEKEQIQKKQETDKLEQQIKLLSCELQHMNKLYEFKCSQITSLHRELMLAETRHFQEMYKLKQNHHSMQLQVKNLEEVNKQLQTKLKDMEAKNEETIKHMEAKLQKLVTEKDQLEKKRVSLQAKLTKQRDLGQTLMDAEAEYHKAGLGKIFQWPTMKKNMKLAKTELLAVLQEE